MKNNDWFLILMVGAAIVAVVALFLKVNECEKRECFFPGQKARWTRDAGCICVEAPK